MNADIMMLNRPPMGFVVEGRGEYNCYPSLVCRVVDASGFMIPRVNAGGYGNIVRRLEEQLNDLVLASHPFHIIITLDLKDVLDGGLYTSCSLLRTELGNKAQSWLINAQDPRLQPLPEIITIVIQVQKFESWMIADVCGLNESGCLKTEAPQFSNVDEEVQDPAVWLQRYMLPGRDQKHPNCAKRIISSLNPVTMRENSPSFDKFYREVLSSYTIWYQSCQIS